MERSNQKGSVLILVLIGTLIISLLGIMGLDQTTTEVIISRNFVADKTALFCAETGINFGINELRKTIDPMSVIFDITESNSYFSVAFKTATIKSGKITDSTPQYITGFTGFTPPPPIGVSVEMGGEAGVQLTAWKLVASAVVSRTPREQARKEIQSVIVLLSTEY